MKNSETAKKYYTEHLAKAEYYSNGSKVEVEWFGLGCTRLGLEPGSKVTQEAFERLCDNLHPQTGEKLTVRHRSNDRRVCTDFVNSTLKSVSIMALLAGDTRILDCHEAATHTAMIQLEKRASTRVRKGGLDGERRTGELVAARVSHLESRALDPQLHTRLRQLIFASCLISAGCRIAILPWHYMLKSDRSEPLASLAAWPLQWRGWPHRLAR